MQQKAPESSGIGQVLRLEDDIEENQTSKQGSSIDECERVSENNSCGLQQLTADLPRNLR